MKLVEALRLERERLGLRLEDVAPKVPCSLSTLSSWERGVRPIPADAVPRLLSALGSVGLGQVHCWECPANPFPVPVLDGADDHPVVVRDKGLIEEAAECAEAARMLVLYNKPDAAKLSELDRQMLERAAEQMVDLLPAVYLALRVLAERYGVEPWALALGLYRKCRERGYTSLGPPAASRYWPQEGRRAA